jgi:hypothetical protein
MQRFGWVGASTFTATKPGYKVHVGSPHRSGIGTWCDVNHRLVAATSLGPVPQSLWMMASILDESGPSVNRRRGAATPVSICRRGVHGTAQVER